MDILTFIITLVFINIISFPATIGFVWLLFLIPAVIEKGIVWLFNDRNVGDVPDPELMKAAKKNAKTDLDKKAAAQEINRDKNRPTQNYDI